MMKQRIVWLDSLKGFLILLVVVGHSIQEVGMHNCPGGEWIWYFIYSFHMLPFMFVARFVCFNPKKSYSLMNIESVVHLILSHPLWELC